MIKTILYAVYIIVIFSVIFYFWTLNSYSSKIYKSKKITKSLNFNNVIDKFIFFFFWIINMFLCFGQKWLKNYNDKIDQNNLDNHKINRLRRLPLILILMSIILMFFVTTVIIKTIHHLLPNNHDFSIAIILILPLSFLSTIIILYFLTFTLLYLTTRVTIKKLTIYNSKKLADFKNKMTIKYLIMETFRTDTSGYLIILKWLGIFVIIPSVYIFTILFIFNVQD